MVDFTGAVLGSLSRKKPDVTAASWVPYDSGRVTAKDAEVNSRPDEYTDTSALQLPAINGAISFLSRQVAAAELVAEEKLEGKRWADVEDEESVPRWARNLGPNIYQNAYDWKQQLMENLLVFGNAFILFENQHKDEAGFPQSFTVWPTRLVTREDDYYRVQTIEGTSHYIGNRRFDRYNPITQEGNVVHLKLTSRENHLWGTSHLKEVAQAFRGMLAADAHSELYFITGGMPQGFLVSRGGDVSDEKKKQMAAYLRQVRENPSNRHIPLLLEGDWEYIAASPDANAAQLLEVRKYAYALSSSVFGVMPKFLGAPDDTTSFDRGMQKFQYDTAIAPLFRMLNWALTDMLPDNQRVRLVLDYFGDAEPLEQARYYERSIGAGWLKRSEVREREGLPEEPGIDDVDQPAPGGANPMRDRSPDPGDSDSSRDVGETNYQENRT